MLFCILIHVSVSAETAKSVLDKTALAISKKDGISASFTISSQNLVPTKGTILLKDKRFQVTMPNTIIWFDGKTQWTYMKHSEEVNINNPTEAELQMINPYNFIYMYRSGYSFTLTKQKYSFLVHLIANNPQKSIKEMKITVNNSTYIPSELQIKQGKRWYTIAITKFQQANLTDNTFRFNSKDFPQAETIDLR